MTTPASSEAAPEAAAPQAPSAEQPGRPPFRLGNRPPLTGIRALAMATVLVYHAKFGAMPGSWVALQIFFVLSGFLITNMLAGEARRNGRVSLAGFYARRAVRLVPPLVLVVALLAVYATFVHVVDSSQRVWGDSLSALFYYSRLPIGPGARPVPRLLCPDLVALGRGAVLHRLGRPVRRRRVTRTARVGLLAGWGGCCAQRSRPHLDRVGGPPFQRDRRRPYLLRIRHPRRRPVLRLPAGSPGGRRLPPVLAPMGMPAAHRGGGGGGRSARVGAVHRPGVH